MERYDPKTIEAKWQRVWQDTRAFEVPNPDPGELERTKKPLAREACGERRGSRRIRSLDYERSCTMSRKA